MNDYAGPFLTDTEIAREWDKQHAHEYLEMKMTKSKFNKKDKSVES